MNLVATVATGHSVLSELFGRISQRLAAQDGKSPVFGVFHNLYAPGLYLIIFRQISLPLRLQNREVFFSI